ncbi:MAG: endonuclease/exonuclease/phosphatase family protein [Gammaproteobacteria bacterium]
MIGGKIDLSRGLPIIFINFLGYDEQSHRRGPRSLFAHWTLKGIDDAIARLWRAANHATWRHYELWIYSDHGQAAVDTYQSVRGYPLETAVTAAFEKLSAGPIAARQLDQDGVQTRRAHLLGGGKFQRLFARVGANDAEELASETLIAALGPVGHVYPPRQLNDQERERVADELARAHKVPVVLTRAGPGRLRAWTETGEFEVPRDCAALFGAQHPFIDSLGADLVRLCEHADAGAFVLLGWREGLRPMTFASESGAHAGLTPDETRGFALLPDDAPLAAHGPAYLRPTDLRDAALRHLGRAGAPSTGARRRSAVTQSSTLRVMTYNVHSCVGMDGKLDAERVARVIARANPDVVALQELDVGRARSQWLDQAHLIARYLEMEFHFHPALHLEEERYGDAILTHLPLRLVRAGVLPGLADKPKLEPRGALWVAVEVDGREVQIINTHLGLYSRERLAQIDALLGCDWLEHEQCRGPVIVCGDFNARPSSPVCRRLGARLRDVQTTARQHRPRGTFSSRFPGVRIDHIFISPGLEVQCIEVPDSELARVASDHLPLVAEIRLPAVEDSTAEPVDMTRAVVIGADHGQNSRS